MKYVMVPVPNDLVEDVDRFIRRLIRGDSQPSGQDQVPLEAAAGVYLALGPSARRLLVTVAKATVDQVPISLADTAAAVGLNLHEAMGMVGEANVNYGLSCKGGGALVLPIPNPAPIAEGCPAWAHNLLAMREDVAAMLLDL